MTALYALYRNGICIGRCDRNCYDATNPRCTCICAGINHGVGIQRAAANTATACDTMVQAYLDEHPDHDQVTARFHRAINLLARQLTLFHPNNPDLKKGEP
jgi:hypothetical protein